MNNRGASLALLTVLLFASQALALTTNEIEQAVRDLGAKEHKTREAATQRLTTAGRAALPALEQAAQSKDPEIRLRAAALLPGARLGLPANFPEDLRDALARYPKANLDEKQATIEKLAGVGRPVRTALMELARSETDLQTRLMVFGDLLQSVAGEVIRRLDVQAIEGDAVTRVQEGVEFYRTILPEDATLPLLAIQRLDALGQRAAAEQIFETTYRGLAQRLGKGEEHEPLNDIAWLCAVARRRLDEGLQFIDQALAKSPKEAAMLDTKAELLFQKGRRDEALELIEKALALSPEVNYFHQQKKRFQRGDPAVPPPPPEGDEFVIP